MRSSPRWSQRRTPWPTCAAGSNWLCKKTNSTLLVAKLSRLSRDAAFVWPWWRTAAFSSALLLCLLQQLPTRDLRTAESTGEEQVSRTKTALAAAKAKGWSWAIPRTWRTGINQEASSTEVCWPTLKPHLVTPLWGRTLREICEVLNDAASRSCVYPFGWPEFCVVTEPRLGSRMLNSLQVVG